MQLDDMKGYDKYVLKEIAQYVDINYVLDENESILYCGDKTLETNEIYEQSNYLMLTIRLDCYYKIKNS
jgi:beta-galactosidase beta subunit